MVGYKAGLMTGAAALLVVLSGCTKKPGGQVVAVVNGEEITQQELNVELQNAHVPQNVDQKKIMPALLQRVVDRRLITQLAKTDGLDKTPAYLEQLRAMQETLLVNQYAQKVAKTISLPDAAAVDAFIINSPTIFSQRKRYNLNQIAFTPTGDATLMRKLEPTRSLDAIAAVLTAAQIPFARGTGNLDTAAVPPEVAAKIASIPSGEPFLLPDNGHIVASVIESVQLLPVSPDKAKPAAVNMMRQKSLQDAVGKKLLAARSSATVSYETGFAPPPSPKPSAAPVAP